MIYDLIHVPEIGSTNNYLIDALSRGEVCPEGTVVYTLRQSAGRGQVGNTWESEFDKNICFSILLRPTFLPIKEQFLLSEITSLAVCKTLSELMYSPFGSCSSKTTSIKWPNDIYIGDEKVCGMLIENSLMGSEIVTSVIGVGININQTRWIGGAPNPTSLKQQTGNDYVPEEVLRKVLEKITHYYIYIKEGKKEKIHREYFENLYRSEGFHPYKDAATGREFVAKIKEVEPSGYLVLEDAEGSTHRYIFKEVKFVLPCGVTKE